MRKAIVKARYKLTDKATTTGRSSHLSRYHAALQWARNNTIDDMGICLSSSRGEPYPEVTGYYIPTLMNWGEHTLARQFARWLMSIQNADGSWSDTSGTSPYTFDTGQILKGLLAIRRRMPEVDESIRRGCDWLLTQIQSDGRIVTPDMSCWGLPDGRMVPEAIHLYALEPLRFAGEVFGEQRYGEAVEKAVQYYLRQPDLVAFDTLSHFHAYILEALVDLGHPDVAAQGMAEVEKLQRKNGSVPAYRDVKWVCSTGLAQYAVVWYKLARRVPAEKAMQYLGRLQNRSGGFNGSYGHGANYFPKEEISWTVKYYLDALFWRIKTCFDADVSKFPDAIDPDDGRYQLIEREATASHPETVLDAGCGKGRFLSRLKEANPQIDAYGMDLSDQMLACLPEGRTPMQGSLLNVPCKDGAFDLAFCVESLEHAVNFPRAIEELGRVIKKNGTLIIIDKNKGNLGQLKISDWEQWMSVEDISRLLREAGFLVTVHHNIPYDGHDGRDGLFVGWVGRKQANRCGTAET